MRVLLVVEQLRRRVPGGIGTYARGLVEGLGAVDRGAVDRGAEDRGAVDRTAVSVTLWASRAPRSQPDPVATLERGARARSAPELPAPELPAPQRSGLEPSVVSPLPSRLLVAAWGAGLARAPRGFGVVHATSLAVPPVGKVPTSVMVHDLAWTQMPEAYPRRGRRWHDAALARGLRRCTLVMVPSRSTADALTRGGGDHRRIEIVEEGCDHLPPADHSGADALLRRLNVTGGYLLTVSTLEPRKNLDRLLRGYSAARPRLPEPWPLVVVGPVGWGRQVSPPPGVVLAGPVHGGVLAGLYRQARLLAYVPVLEGFGLPPVEAMHACTPVVASPVPSTGGAAFEVDPLDVGAIAAALVEVASVEAVRTELVTAGVLRAGELTWERTARRHIELWSSMQ